VLFTWVYNNTNGSLFLLVLFHTVATTATDTFLIPVKDLTVPFSQKYGDPLLFLILLWVAVTLVTIIAGAARLSRNVAPAQDGESRFEQIRLSISRVRQEKNDDAHQHVAS
jgi:hypothetical protein